MVIQLNALDRINKDKILNKVESDLNVVRSTVLGWE